MNNAILVIAGLLAAAGSAEAASGTVKGRVVFYQNNNDYCPAGADCTAANYLEAEYNTYQPLVNIKVYLEDGSGNVIGQSATSSTGHFTMSWYSAALPSSARVVARPHHKDGRFQIYTAAGSTLKVPWSFFAPVDGATQDRGSLAWGTSTNPSPYANVFNGAQRMWDDALKYSSDMLNNFTNVAVYAFGNDDECDTSCASGKSVWLDSNATYVLSARIMHELGHVVSGLAKPWDTDADYCYGTPDAEKCYWNFTSQEWKSRSFEEGIATFFGDVSLFWYWATAPSVNGVSRELNSTCQSGEGRWAQSALRYVWDVYDSVDDAGWVDDSQYSYDTIVETLQKFCDGTGNHCASEGKVNFDGRSAIDFAYNLALITGDTTPTERANNCQD